MHAIEADNCYLNTNPKCKPQLCKRGLYNAFGGLEGTKQKEVAMLWILNLSDGNHSWLDISKISNIDFPIIVDTANLLEEHNLIKKCAHSAE